MTGNEAEPAIPQETPACFETDPVSKHLTPSRSLRLRTGMDLDRAMRLASDLEDAELVLRYLNGQSRGLRKTRSHDGRQAGVAFRKPCEIGISYISSASRSGDIAARPGFLR